MDRDNLKLLVFIPSFNDTFSAYRLAKKFLKNEDIDKVLLVDDSDDDACISYANKMRVGAVGRIKVVQRKRSGKWSAWRMAFEEGLAYDGMIEVDADVEIDDIDILISSLEKFDCVTAYQEIKIPEKGLEKIISLIYRDMHEELQDKQKFNMGGQIIALSNRVLEMFFNKGLFMEPVVADDHVVCLAAYALGFKCSTIDCGFQIGLPSNVKDWIRYRSRHRGAINWAESYVAAKTGLKKRTKMVSRYDFSLTLKSFLKSVFKNTLIFAPLLLVFLAISSRVMVENPVKWTRIDSEKIS